MTNPTSNFGWQMPTATDLVTDLPADFEVFGQAVDTDFVDLLGGTTGQVLSKTSATDLDFTWVTANPGDITGVTAGTGITGGGTSGTVTVTNDMATTITAAGDIVVGTGSGTYDNLPIGTTAQVLTADTTVSPYKVKWAAVAGGGVIGSKTITAGADYTTTSGTLVAVSTSNARVTVTAPASGTIIALLTGWAENTTGYVMWSVSVGAGTVYEQQVANNSYLGINFNAGSIHIVTGLTAGTSYNVDWMYRTAGTGTAVMAGSNNNVYPRMVVLAG